MSESPESEEPQRGRTARGWIPGSFGFWFSGPVLLLAVFGEALYSLAALAVFILTAGRRRAVARTLFTGSDMSSSRVITALFLGFSLACLSACAQAPETGSTSRPFPGSSFEQKLQHLAWSTEVLLEMDYTGKMVYDDFVTLFIGDEKELSTHYLEESIEMLGW